MRILLATIAATLTLAATTLATPTHAENERFVFVSHAPDADSWWNTIKNALRHAEEHFGVTVEYRNPPTGDLADMARIIEQSVAANPDGLITTIADFDVLSGAIGRAIDKGIPVITVNSGTHDQSARLGALLHIGQPEYDAGFGAGKRAADEAGAKTFLCVNHYITNPASVERCQGFADALGVELGNQMIDSGQDPAEIKNKVLAYMRANEDTDAIITLGPTSAHPTIAALNEIGMAGEIYFGSFDLSAEIAAAVKDGTIAFGIDQQPYLQGYMPIVLLVNYVRYGVIPANNINSGPGFVTKDNIAQVEEHAGTYR